jgi:hypothetical protein
MPDIHPFDLQARAELAAHGLTALLDPARPGVMYFLADWRARPPRADHGLWDCGDGSGRHTDALTLARSMARAGSPAAAPSAAEHDIEAWMLSLLGADGLSWLPHEPWAAPWGQEWLLAGGAQAADEDYAEVSWAQRATLMALISRFAACGDERYLQRAKRLADGLLRIAVRHDDGLFFPEGYYTRGGWHSHQVGLFPGIEENNAVGIYPLLRLYEVAGYTPALVLAEGLTRFTLRHTRGYAADGRLQAPAPGALQSHFHTRSCLILSVLKLGIMTARPEYVAWARQSYALAQEWGTDFGWFPEGLGMRHGEICCTTDMLEIALLLGRHVDRRYYADAERYGRNQLLESQFTDLDRLQTGLARLPERAAGPASARPRPYSTADDVAGRQVGGFASRSTLNDAFHLDATDLMQCCNAAGTRALYDLWRYVADGGAAGGHLPQLAVNLRFSADTPHLRVVSHEPSEGRLTITARQAGRLQVRLPEGVTQAVAAHPAGGACTLPAQGGYVTLEAVPGQTVDLYYPLPERTAFYQVGSGERTLSVTGHWRGETLMAVDPPGPFYPLYGRPAGLPPVEPGPPAGPLIESL